MVGGELKPPWFPRCSPATPEALGAPWGHQHSAITAAAKTTSEVMDMDISLTQCYGYMAQLLLISRFSQLEPHESAVEKHLPQLFQR